MRKKKGLPVEEGLKRCGNTPDGHFSARPIPRDPGISPCTNDRQVSWLSGHHSTAPSHFRNGILRHYSPVHSDEIVQDLHLFPFNPLTRGLRGQRHPSFCVFGSISLYHACEKKQSFFTSVHRRILSNSAFFRQRHLIPKPPHSPSISPFCYFRHFSTQTFKKKKKKPQKPVQFKHFMLVCSRSRKRIFV